MIAIDSSTLIAYLGGETGEDIDVLDHALLASDATIPPVVVTELLSAPHLPQSHRATILGLPTLDLQPGYWERAATLRSILLGRKLRAYLADALIAQSCIDHRVPLLTRDRDFQAFSRYSGLALALDAG